MNLSKEIDTFVKLPKDVFKKLRAENAALKEKLESQDENSMFKIYIVQDALIEKLKAKIVAADEMLLNVKKYIESEKDDSNIIVEMWNSIEKYEAL